MNNRLPAGVAGLGLLVGFGFLLPVLAYLRGGAGQRPILLLLAAAGAVLVVRRCGHLLRGLLDAAAPAWRLPLLGVYGLAAMILPVAFLLLR